MLDLLKTCKVSSPQVLQFLKTNVVEMKHLIGRPETQQVHTLLASLSGQPKVTFLTQIHILKTLDKCDPTPDIKSRVLFNLKNALFQRQFSKNQNNNLAIGSMLDMIAQHEGDT